MTALVAYYRIPKSDKDQYLLLDQKKAVAAWMADHCQIVGQFVEVETQGDLSRPQLLRALSMAKRENATLLVAKLGRLDLSPIFLATLMESQVDVASADAPSFQSESLAVSLFKAQRRSRTISRKNAITSPVAGTEGLSPSLVTAPRPNQRCLSPNNGALRNAENADAFAASVVQIIKEQIERDQSLHFIAASLNERKIPTARGGRWYPTTVRNILRRNAQMRRNQRN